MGKDTYSELARDDQAQTLQDYLLGVALMLLAVTFIIGYLPTIFDSYDSVTESVRSDQADRAAEYLVTNYSITNTANVLKYEEPGGINRTLSQEEGLTALREAAALDTSTDRRVQPEVNVILVNTSVLTTRDDLIPIRDGTVYAYGDDYDGESAAQANRVVKLNGSSQCTPTCWLVVRVWQ